ncbi:MAG: hypothetical protein OXD36_15040, partial [Rhodobacter sp.]|nr:hypothetical protein [Rhodobacter sp.]
FTELTFSALSVVRYDSEAIRLPAVPEWPLIVPDREAVPSRRPLHSTSGADGAVAEEPPEPRAGDRP